MSDRLRRMGPAAAGRGYGRCEEVLEFKYPARGCNEFVRRNTADGISSWNQWAVTIRCSPALAGHPVRQWMSYSDCVDGHYWREFCRFKLP